MGGRLGSRGICGCPRSVWKVSRKADDAHITRAWADTGGTQSVKALSPALWHSPPCECPSAPLGVVGASPTLSGCPASGSCEAREGGLHGAHASVLLIWPSCLKTSCLKLYAIYRITLSFSRGLKRGENQTFS